MIRIVHIADVHLDTPMTALPPALAAARRESLREEFRRVLTRAGEAGVEAVLLCGDLFDSNRVTPGSARILPETARKFPKTHYFVAPGNHDCLTASSPYRTMDRPENLVIFDQGRIERVDLPGASVYGYGCLQENSDRSPLAGFRVQDPERVNLFCLHAQVQGFGGHAAYSPITLSEIAASGVDYLALGHVHACSGVLKAGGTHYAYPGVLCGRGFDETGRKGYLAGQVDRAAVRLGFLETGAPTFEWVRAELNGAQSMREVCELAERAVEGLPDETLLKLTLAGTRRADLLMHRPALQEALGRFAFCRIEDETRPAREYEKLMLENTLRGIYLRRLSALDAPEEIREKAVSLGLAALSGEELADCED